MHFSRLFGQFLAFSGVFCGVGWTPEASVVCVWKEEKKKEGGTGIEGKGEKKSAVGGPRLRGSWKLDYLAVVAMVSAV